MRILENIVFVFFFFPEIVKSELTEIKVKQSLFDYLFLSKKPRKYNKWIRPVEKSSDTIDVFLKLKVNQVIDVDEKNQLIHTSLWLKKSWIDINLKWDPKNFENITKIRIPSKYIWTPNIVLIRNADGNYTVSDMTRALIRYNGNVTWEPPATYKSWCNVDVTFFPFDVQNCSLKFASWTYPSSQVVLKSWNDKTDLDRLIENGEWKVIDVIVKESGKRSAEAEANFVTGSLSYFFIIRRLPLFHTLFLITPCLGLSFLTGLVFYLPGASKEKITLSTSVLLAHTFYLLLITEIIPATSKKVPIISIYLLCAMSFISFSIVVTTTIIWIQHRSSNSRRQIPDWLKLKMSVIGPKILISTEYPPHLLNKVSKKDPTKKKSSQTQDLQRRLSSSLSGNGSIDDNSLLSILPELLKTAIDRTENKINAEKEEECWIYASMILDRIFLIVFIFLSIFGALALFLPPAFAQMTMPLYNLYN